jgi:uncharacterized protein (DUF924 family)
MTASKQDILKFWFQEADSKRLDFSMKRWFEPNKKFDAEIKSKFFSTIEDALNGKLDDWAATIDGSIALILIYDQFTRNIYRNSATAYTGDCRALEIAKNVITLGHDEELPLLQRLFLYLPFMHAENKMTQEQSVELYKKLVGDSPSSVKKYFSESLEFAKKHKEVIDKFGRFPHRNKDLGRESTKEEIEFIKKKGRGF